MCLEKPYTDLCLEDPVTLKLKGKTTELGIPRTNHDIPGYPVCTKVARAQLIGQRRFFPWFGPKRPGCICTHSCVILFSKLYGWLGPVGIP